MVPPPIKNSADDSLLKNGNTGVKLILNEGEIIVYVTFENPFFFCFVFASKTPHKHSHKYIIICMLLRARGQVPTRRTYILRVKKTYDWIEIFIHLFDHKQIFHSTRTHTQKKKELYCYLHITCSYDSSPVPMTHQVCHNFNNITLIFAAICLSPWLIIRHYFVLDSLLTH